MKRSAWVLESKQVLNTTGFVTARSLARLDRPYGVNERDVEKAVGEVFKLYLGQETDRRAAGLIVPDGTNEDYNK